MMIFFNGISYRAGGKSVTKGAVQSEWAFLSNCVNHFFVIASAHPTQNFLTGMYFFQDRRPTLTPQGKKTDMLGAALGNHSNWRGGVPE
jgi:hypothetical protein